MTSILLVALLCCFFALLPSGASEFFPTYSLSENLQQEITSSALNWVSADQNFKDYDEAVIGAYPSDTAGDNTIKRPVYVCRARQTFSWLGGYLRPSDRKCVVSLYGQVHHASDYQILINTENTARLSWASKTRYTMETQGTVLGGQDPNRNFVGRVASNNSQWTYILGYMDPSKNFGTFIYVDDKGEQMESEEGELLVETEPKAYEFRNIKYGSGNKPPMTEKRILGTAILKNDMSDDMAKVESVIPYNYTLKVNWGHGHGLITGLPLYIYQKNRSVDEYAWGVPSVDPDKQEISQIEYILEPGTAVNVTLTAKYVDADIPYSATLVSIYKDGEKKERIIKDTLREAMLRDITPIYSAVYFLGNYSLVPTTTTSTTTTTEATTTITTKKTTTIESRPIGAPEIQVTNNMKGLDDLNKGDNEVMSDQEDTVSLLTKAEESTEGGGSPPLFLSKVLVLATVLLTILRLT